MILVDSGVWIDYLGGRSTRQANWLDQQLGVQRVLVGDLMLAEVLQGCRTDREFNNTRAQLLSLPFVEIADREVAIEAARNYRTLRAMGVTIRKTIDTLIATRCIVDDIPLLYSDRDFDPFVEHLDLRSALADTGLN
ncbi:type II toxin-antitoxin system VapC family toxin [Sphingomonas sp.]|uniref:type II toxin-antitoxin system VapC family toxin n=1 Tax=Sphingomonas sp. TaxID=28214 RepID=UPI003CC6C860